jgi:two-component system, OmpR family, copper resistance phosphate regulon response regulator CusR
MRRPRILLVEDDDKLGVIYREHLERSGLDVKLSKDGEVALSDAKSFEPDLILLDIMIPKLDGYDTLEALRLDPDTKHTKIIILSALDATAYQQKGKELGADDYMIKAQSTIDDIVNRVKQHLSELSLETESN